MEMEIKRKYEGKNDDGKIKISTVTETKEVTDIKQLKEFFEGRKMQLAQINNDQVKVSAELDKLTKKFKFVNQQKKKKLTFLLFFIQTGEFCPPDLPEQERISAAPWYRSPFPGSGT